MPETHPFDVLLVHPEDPAPAGLVAALEKAGCNVYTCRLDQVTGQLARFPPDIVVLEEADARLDRLRLLRESAGGEEPPVVALVPTGVAPPAALREELQLDEFLAHPVDPAYMARRTKAFASARRRAQRNVERVRQQEDELELARAVQRNLLPFPLPERQGVQTAARYQPIDQLGGDFFDVVDLGQDATGFFLADVVGHGTGAALFTSFLKAQLLHWSLLMQKETPGETLTDMNLALVRVFGGTGRFVTALYATFEPGIERLHFANAGHPPPVYLSKEGETYLLEGGELPLGILGSTIYQTREIRFTEGDRVFFHTDGMNEQRWHGRGEAFGKGRLVACLEETRHLPLEKSLDELMARLDEWTAGGQEDDWNILGIEAQA